MLFSPSRARCALVVVVFGLLLAPAVSADDSSQPEVTFQATELGTGLYALIAHGGFGGGNIGLLAGEDGVFMIDDSFPPFTATLLEAVEKTAGAPIDFVLNTHLHGDHAGGNQTLAQSGTTIVAHDNVRSRLLTDGMSAGAEPTPVPPEALPVLTFDNTMTFHLNGQEAHVFHVAEAHTDGDAIIHFKDADVIHTGDVFFHTMFPFIDADSGGSLDGYIAAQERIHEVAGDATRIIPGHGPIATRADLAASIAMLKEAKAAVAALVAAGKTLEETVAARPLEKHEGMSWQFISTERMIGQLYGALSSE
ncbi:MAG: MBL fold metallo-hydrolase [Acidobacteriota bacterium]